MTSTPVSYTHLDVYKRQLRALPEPVPWVAAVVDRLEGLRAILDGDHGAGADRLAASSARLEELGLALSAAFGWLEWAELGLSLIHI